MNAQIEMRALPLLQGSMKQGDKQYFVTILISASVLLFPLRNS